MKFIYCQQIFLSTRKIFSSQPKNRYLTGNPSVVLVPSIFYNNLAFDQTIETSTANCVAKINRKCDDKQRFFVGNRNNSTWNTKSMPLSLQFSTSNQLNNQHAFLNTISGQFERFHQPVVPAILAIDLLAANQLSTIKKTFGCLNLNQKSSCITNRSNSNITFFVFFYIKLYAFYLALCK